MIYFDFLMSCIETKIIAAKPESTSLVKKLTKILKMLYVNDAIAHPNQQISTAARRIKEIVTTSRIKLYEEETALLDFIMSDFELKSPLREKTFKMAITNALLPKEGFKKSMKSGELHEQAAKITLPVLSVTDLRQSSASSKASLASQLSRSSISSDPFSHLSYSSASESVPAALWFSRFPISIFDDCATSAEDESAPWTSEIHTKPLTSQFARGGGSGYGGKSQDSTTHLGSTPRKKVSFNETATFISNSPRDSSSQQSLVRGIEPSDVVGLSAGTLSDKISPRSPTLVVKKQQTKISFEDEYEDEFERITNYYAGRIRAHFLPNTTFVAHDGRNGWTFTVDKTTFDVSYNDKTSSITTTLPGELLDKPALAQSFINCQLGVFEDPEVAVSMHCTTDLHIKQVKATLALILDGQPELAPTSLNLDNITVYLNSQDTKNDHHFIQALAAFKSNQSVDNLHHLRSSVVDRHKSIHP